MTEPTPSTFVVGAGPVAATLAGALRRAGVPVLGLWARRADAARRAGALAGVAAFSAAPPDLLLEAKVLVLAVRDDAIAEVARTLVETGLVTRAHTMIHCSGATASARAFAGVADQIGGRATMHPLRAIVDARQAITQLAGVRFGIEGDERGVARARALVAALGGVAIDLAGEQMALYHAAASLASNQLVALLDLAREAFQTAGLPPQDALAAATQLAEGALANVQRLGLPDALTGPIARGDAQTVRAHLGALAAVGSAPRDAYRLLSRRVAELAAAKGEASPAALDEIRKALAG